MQIRHRRGLACTIWPQESEYLPRGDLQRAFVKGDYVAEPFAETVEAEHEVILARKNR